MTRQLLSLAALFAMGVAINASACATCGCEAPKAKPAACPASSCAKPADCPATRCATVADKAGCPASCKKPCCPVKNSAADHDYEVIGTTGLKKLLASGEKVTVVDARSGKWDDGRRIGNAQQLAANASDDEITKALPNKDAKIVAYCTNTKCPASAALAHKLADLGYKNVIKYPDGVDGWQAEGNAVKQVK